MPSYLLNNLEKIKNTLKKKKEILLFLDYDGTLISFQDKPDEVVTPKDIKKTLKDLSKIDRVNIFIITGRKLSDIKKLVPLDSISYAALHGIQIEFEDNHQFLWPQAKKIRPLLKDIKNKAYVKFQSDDKILIEDKKYTLAFHYRMIPKEKIKFKTKRFLDLVKRIDKENKLNIIKGDKVIEIRPYGWDKGKAVNVILDRYKSSSTILPIYIGDDTTDNDAFKYLCKTGITVYVQNKSELDPDARYYLKNPDEVKKFLDEIYDFL